MTKNCWRSVDTHIHDGAGRVLQSVLLIKAANNSFMTDYNLSEVWFPRTHDQKSLTLIFMMGQGGYCNLFCLWRLPIIPLWLSTTYRRCDFPGRMTKNRWCSIDAHFAMAVSAICNHLIWHSPSFTLFLAAFLVFLFTFFLITTLFFNNT